MHNDSLECSRAEHYSLALTMSGCTAEEFTCADGNCVPMEVRGDRDTKKQSRCPKNNSMRD